MSAAELDVLDLSAVADAATGKRDFELLAGLPDVVCPWLGFVRVAPRSVGISATDKLSPREAIRSR